MQTTENTETPVVTTKPAKKERVARADSKLAKASAIFDENPGLARKDLIKLYVDQLGMSASAAGTYVYLVRKKNRK